MFPTETASKNPGNVITHRSAGKSFVVLMEAEDGAVPRSHGRRVRRGGLAMFLRGELDAGSAANGDTEAPAPSPSPPAWGGRPQAAVPPVSLRALLAQPASFAQQEPSGGHAPPPWQPAWGGAAATTSPPAAHSLLEIQHEQINRRPTAAGAPSPSAGVTTTSDAVLAAQLQREEDGALLTAHLARHCGLGSAAHFPPEPAASPAAVVVIENKEDLCVVCLSAPARVGLVHGDSAHKCCCKNCAAQLGMRGSRCPLCNAPVTAMLDIY